MYYDKSRARKIFYWPGMSTEIEKYIAKCKTCLKFSRRSVKEPMIQHERPKEPFLKVAADILTYGGKDYLTLVDYFSNWIELVQLNYKTASEVIEKLKLIFSIQGIPKMFISDNMPFNSTTFKEFARDWEFDLITSSPKYPKSNGLAERAVGICKNILKKCQETNIDIHKALLEYRNTPLTGTNTSPAELLNNRILRTTLPATNQILNGPISVDLKRIEKQREKAKLYYDRQAKERPNNYNKGQSVMIYKNTHWAPGQIIKQMNQPRSYLVRSETGSTVRRNTSFLRPTPNPVPEVKREIIPDKSNNSKTTDPYTTRFGRVIHGPVIFKY